ncbi:hypothetical protein JCM33374_g586 [Metschnikowia sp. JCM 33374]|nr:hypothetical protein JCM33374_g586 [Metschnikowia sp. JCM 33374]
MCVGRRSYANCEQLQYIGRRKKQTKEIPTPDSTSNEGEEKPNEVHLTKLFIGLDIAEGQKKLDIQYPCAEFFGICKGWSSYNEQMHFVQIKNVKVYDLPNDVYVEGETRPNRPSKRKRSNLKQDGSKRPKSIVQSSAEAES